MYRTRFAPCIHGGLLKLGFAVAQSSVAKYLVTQRGAPSQGWRIFLRNHVPDIAAMNLFVISTIGFDLLYSFVIIRLEIMKRDRAFYADAIRAAGITPAAGTSRSLGPK